MVSLSLLGLLAALFFTGCIVREERQTRAYPAPPPPPVAAEEYPVPYDDPGRGWYIEGYYGPNHIWIAPFWTVDIGFVHTHFDHYRGQYRPRFEEHFKHHPERYENSGHEGGREGGHEEHR